MKVTYTELKGKAEQGYGVTRWASAKEINQSLAELTSQPIYSVSEEAYKDICDNYYDRRQQVHRLPAGGRSHHSR